MLVVAPICKVVEFGKNLNELSPSIVPLLLNNTSVFAASLSKFESAASKLIISIAFCSN